MKEGEMTSFLGSVVERAGEVGIGAPIDGRAKSSHSSSDAFCPECGQSLRLRAHPEAPAATGGPWVPWLFLVVGACLLLAFGGPVWKAFQLVGGLGTLPHLALTGELGRAPLHDTRALVQSADLPPASEAYWHGRAQLDHDLPRLALGAALGLVGLGALARRGLLSQGEADPAERGPVPRTLSRLLRERALGGAWRLAEGGLTALLLLALATSAYLLGTEVRAGASPTAELAFQVANRTIDAWSFATAALQTFLGALDWPAGPGGT
jgi:hypothetical protein